MEEIDTIIEQKVENKINQLLDILPQPRAMPKMIHEYTVYEIYQGTINTILNIINDITELYSQRSYINQKVYRQRIFDIFFSSDRKIFLGITLVILSFIVYFIDAADA